MDFDRQSCDDKKISIVASLVTKNFDHHMLGDQKVSITIFSVCYCGPSIYIKEYLMAKEE
jgi:hypothetical protein